MLGEIRLLVQSVPPGMAATLLRSTDKAKKMDEADAAAKKVTPTSGLTTPTMANPHSRPRLQPFAKPWPLSRARPLH